MPEFLPLSGEDGVSGAGICPSLVLDIQIPHSDLPPTPGTSPYPSSPDTESVRGTSTPALQPGPVEGGEAGTVKGEGLRGGGEDADCLSDPTA